MAGTVLEITDLFDRSRVAEEISNMWFEWQSKRREKLEEWQELRNYLFATDTTKTSNSSLPWKNTVTIPKLTEIRDTLHANYMAALFPKDDWLKWEGGDPESVEAGKAKAIESYMKNKLREGGFEQIVSKLLYDYIDYGNVVADVEYVKEVHTDAQGEEIPGYVGPRAVRHSIFDIVFNPLAVSFDKSPKITRSIKTFGELKQEAENKPEYKYNLEIIAMADSVRSRISTTDYADWAKNDAYTIDGFGNLLDYYKSEYVEILEFEGDIHDESGLLKQNRLITVIDRSFVIRDIQHPSWFGKSTKQHTGWRPRPDNLYAMGPLDNLVGMQYRMDHIENLKDDALDLAVMPPVVLQGNVEEFNYEPLGEIYVGDDGSVTEMGKNLQGVIAAENQVAILEQRMEQMAGAPKQVRGIRTPGEKTKFEVQDLGNRADRMFIEKLRNFEIFMEDLVNNMLEVARRNIDGQDLVRVMDDDIGVIDFLKINKVDLTAKGKLRPIGSKHFIAQSQLFDNLNMVFNSPIGQLLMPHTSSKSLTTMVEEALGVERFNLFTDNAQIFEQAETQRLINQLQENVEVEAITPDESEEDFAE